MKWSAVAKAKRTGCTVLLKNQDYPTKAAFISDIRGNGYAVNPKKVKPSDLFDYILTRTNCNPWDWDLTEIPNE